METVRTDTLQAQGREKWLSRTRFVGRDKLYKIAPNRYKVDSEIHPALPPPTVESGYVIIFLIYHKSASVTNPFLTLSL